MLQQLVHIFIVSLICCLWGFPVLLVHTRKTPADHAWYKTWLGFVSFLFFTGCITIGIVASWIYLVWPLKFIYLLYLSVIPAVLVLFYRKKISTILPPRGRRPPAPVITTAFPSRMPIATALR